MLSLTKKLGETIRIRCSCGDVLVLRVREGEKKGTVALEFSGVGGLIVSEESLLKDIHWMVSPKPEE